MCFSQGCSLASSLLLYNQTQHPKSPPLFKAAMFICGGVPLDVLSSLGIDVTDEARQLDDSSKVALQQMASSEAILRDGYDRWRGGFDPFAADPENGTGERKTVFGIDVARIPKEMKIPIPTAHVYGAQDPRFPASVTLAQFCDDAVRRTYDHGGGHEIPRKRDVSETMAELVEWCALMAERW
jgi:pimeloyl-ACP methyl ester carboxylesterase